MKGILVILDGMGDLPNSQLKGKTPLEAADTFNLDFLATRGEMGYLYPVKPGFIPESDEAITSIFGNSLISSTRGQLEARGADIKLTRGDLAFRANFATIENIQNKKIIDRRAGRTLTTEEAEILSKAINKIQLPVKFEFKSTIQHRAVLVFRGGFSDNISGNDSTYFQGKNKDPEIAELCKSFDEEENSQYSANIVNEFLTKAYETLNNHPINQQRKAKGLMPANYILIRDPGIEIPKLKQYKKWMSVTYMPFEKGFSEFSGIKSFSFDYPKLKKLDAYANLYEGLQKACKHSIKMLKKHYKQFDYAYLHIKETDLPGHDNKPLEKKQMIEYIDQTLFKFLRAFAPKRKIRIIVTADHSTPCKLKNHSADPVPVLFYNNSMLKEKHFSEKEARNGLLKGMVAGEMLIKTGFTR